MFTLIDGPMGTELARRGVAIDGPQWSAAAICTSPDVIAEIHREYAQAGAVVHTANTFRTKERNVGSMWRRLTIDAVELARGSVPSTHRVAGSNAPLADCYRPDLSPTHSRPEHRAMAACLADAGCDLILCETFANLSEARIAVQESVATNVETWAALTAGPDAELLTPHQFVMGAAMLCDAGASAVLLNCTSATKSLPYLVEISSAGLPIPFGVYANAGRIEDRVGWTEQAHSFSAVRTVTDRAETGEVEPDGPETDGPAKYCELAESWLQAGATIIGGCCGTGPRHIAALSRLESA